MSDPVLIALIGATGTFLLSLVTLVSQIITVRKVEQVHKATNSMKDQLVAATKSDALKEGHSQGVSDEKARIATKTVIEQHAVASEQERAATESAAIALARGERRSTNE